MHRIRVVIADDERPARCFLADTLRRFGDVEVIGEAADGIEAIQMIESLHPDLALLDVRMPEMNGPDVVKQLKAPVPIVVFISGADWYAGCSPELGALDCLLKPVTSARLRETINSVHVRMGHA